MRRTSPTCFKVFVSNVTSGKWARDLWRAAGGGWFFLCVSGRIRRRVSSLSLSSVNDRAAEAIMKKIRIGEEKRHSQKGKKKEERKAGRGTG